MKTLYVSDLDGTLLRSDETLSLKTVEILSNLIQQGMLFSYATARSGMTSKKVTQGLDVSFPIIVYNGTFVLDNQTNERLVTNTFDSTEIFNISKLLEVHHLHPIVYSLINDQEKFSYNKHTLNEGMKQFLDTRRNDVRERILDSDKGLFDGEVFYFTCIDEKEKLEPVYELLNQIYPCVFDEDLYSHKQWLEIKPIHATKAHALLQLKDYYHCDKVVCFGDGKNDLSMFKVADESYAMENANPLLKEVATGVIGHHDEDGVALFLEKHFKGKV